jgi:hypothetical protein
MNKRAFRRLLVAGMVHPYAMVSFLEGLLGAPKGSYSSSRDYRGTLREMEQDPNLIKRFGSSKALREFIHGRHAFDDAVMRGARNLARKYPHLIGDTGRQTVEELAQNLMAGLTLVGNAESAQGNIFRRTGLTVGKRGDRITGPSIERALVSFTQDQGRGLRTTRAPVQSLNAPLGADSEMTFLDFVEEGQFSTREIGDLMMQATDGLGLAYFDKCMKRKRLSQNQYEVWQVILMHPEVVDLTENGWKMRGERICDYRARMFPGFEPGTNCRATIRKPTKAVLKRLDECIADESFTRRVRQNKELLDTVSGRRASIRRVASASQWATWVPVIEDVFERTAKKLYGWHGGAPGEQPEFNVSKDYRNFSYFFRSDATAREIERAFERALKRWDVPINTGWATHEFDNYWTYRLALGEPRTASNRTASNRTANNHPLKVGDILYSSWGYDQTNIDFYEVLKVTKSMAIIHRIDSRIVRRDIPYDYVVPVPGKLSSRGKPLRKRVRPDGMVGISSYASASPWDGKPKGKTTSGYGH